MNILKPRWFALSCLIAGMTLLGQSAETWAANLNNIRIKPHANKTEVVLDLSGPVSDLNVNEDNPGQIAIQFSGHVSKALKGKTRAVPKPKNLKSVYWEERGGRVQIFIKRQAPSTTAVFPLHKPSRLVISSDNSYSHTQTGTVAPGVLHQHIVKSHPRGPLNIHVLNIDPQHPEVDVHPVLAAERIHGKARVTQMVSRDGALAGVNAAFFKPDWGTNLGTMILNWELIAGPIYNRVSLGMTEEKTFKMARVGFHGKLTSLNGQTLPIHNVNQPRLSKDEYVLYSSRWGRIAPLTPKNGIQIQIDANNRITQSSTERLTIPDTGYVLVGPSMGLARAMRPGDSVAMEIYTSPDWSNVVTAISGGPYLIRNGQIYVDTKAQSFKTGSFTKPAPRTAVGVTADNRLLMVTVDGRQKSSAGVTLHEMATIMKSLGAINAMNLDGGSSTQMVIRGRVVNSPTVRGGAPVSSALVVKHNPASIQHETIGERNDSTTTNF